jgi:ribosome-associated protein
MKPLVINDRIVIPEAELEWTAVASGGPGGQNVNKVASKVELRWNLPVSMALSFAAKERLRALATHRLDRDGKLLVVSQLTRDQGRNLEDALEKLRELILQALVVPRPRRPTRPTKASKERRLDGKRRDSAKKKDRKSWD